VNPASPATERTLRALRAPILNRIFSFPGMVAGVLLVLAMLTVRERFDDPDMWWHLKTGEVIWTTHTIPTTDIFSYTTNHHASIPHEWLSQLLIYAAFRFGGYFGLMLWLCFFTAALLIAGYGLCSVYSGNAKVAFLGALTIWFFGTIGFSIRPQMIGYLLLIVELLLLHLGCTRNPRWFFALPPLFALWVNCHGSFTLGIAIAATFLVSSWFNFQSGSLVAVPWDIRARQLLSISLALSIGALFLNPVGVKLILYPLQAVFVPSVGLNAVSEWLPLQLADPRGIALLAVLACVALRVITRNSELFWHELLLLALSAWLAGSHRRLLFPFGILVAPILSRVLSNSWENYDAERDRPLPNAVLIALALLIAFFWAFPSRQNLAAQVQAHSPVKAVEYIKSHNLSGPMLNEWADGGYLLWAAPEHPDFIDGRGDVFEWAGVLAEFGKWATLQSPPTDLLNKYQISFCLLSRGSPMAFVLPLISEWKAVYSDDKYVIFQRIPPVGPTQ
jgi:hypothetical protein